MNCIDGCLCLSKFLQLTRIENYLEDNVDLITKENFIKTMNWKV
jgi:hypothetical protein